MVVDRAFNLNKTSRYLIKRNKLSTEDGTEGGTSDGAVAGCTRGAISGGTTGVALGTGEAGEARRQPPVDPEAVGLDYEFERFMGLRPLSSGV